MEVYTTMTPAHKTETSFQTLSSVAGAERIKPNTDSDKEWHYAHPQGSAVWIIPACVIIAAIVAKIAMSKFYNSHYLCIETFKGNIKNCVKSVLARLYAPGRRGKLKVHPISSSTNTKYANSIILLDVESSSYEFSKHCVSVSNIQVRPVSSVSSHSSCRPPSSSYNLNQVGSQSKLLRVPEIFYTSHSQPASGKDTNNNDTDYRELRREAISPTYNISKYSSYASSLVIDLQQCSSPSLRPDRTEQKQEYMIGAGLIRNYANSESTLRAEVDCPTEFKLNGRSGHHRTRGFRSMHDRLFYFRY